MFQLDVSSVFYLFQIFLAILTCYVILFYSLNRIATSLHNTFSCIFYFLLYQCFYSRNCISTSCLSYFCVQWFCVYSWSHMCWTNVLDPWQMRGLYHTIPELPALVNLVIFYVSVMADTPECRNSFTQNYIFAKILWSINFSIVYFPQKQ